ncbi:ferric reductase NAD binding domain-containing protein [Chaetomium strumarium]|uniref:Ferric reductase NAD binding domain-containing protein n=1 Tax=Chaetomium strumarium TaxID=1170767 RepID=A0AAJ0GTF5_9PEZI|nr:ferric reductase NAD binding domain-containing protein [Chaetomium strumarium]
MAWPNYHFLDPSPAEKQVRRQTLDKYALYAQLSALVLVAFVLLSRLGEWRTKGKGSSRGDYDAVPSSPVLKERRNSGLEVWNSRARRVRWWLGEDVVVAGMVLGQRDQWVAGISWTAWLLLLCVLQTGEDYLHLTKRLGIVAVSQYPLQYLLALKSLNPVAYILQSSHEQVNRWHRVLARVTTTLLCLHVALYLNFFVQTDRLHRLGDPVVFAGLMALFGLSLLLSTSLRPIRRYSYRLFFIIHVVVGTMMPLMVITHAAPTKAFLLEALAVFFLDLGARKFDTVIAQATMQSIPGTDLIKISASIPRSKVNRFRGHPGSHIYLSIPAAARRSMSATSISHLLFELLFNPFTVAAVDEDTGDLTMVARHCGGPMTKALRQLAGAASDDLDQDRIPLSIEGPYGAASRFPQLCAEFDRVLLVAGGVGATFTLPLYRSITSENPGAKVEMVWAIRASGDATWAVTGKEAQTLLKDDNIHIFITRDMVNPEGPDLLRREWTHDRRADGSRVDDDGEGEVEMSAMYHDCRRGQYTTQHNRKRPDLKQIVDNLFRHGHEERVAVLVCGPNEMARELREYVGAWVKRGRPVLWHKEGFGF